MGLPHRHRNIPMRWGAFAFFPPIKKTKTKKNLGCPLKKSAIGIQFFPLTFRKYVQDSRRLTLFQMLAFCFSTRTSVRFLFCPSRLNLISSKIHFSPLFILDLVPQVFSHSGHTETAPRRYVIIGIATMESISREKKRRFCHIEVQGNTFRQQSRAGYRWNVRCV